MNSTSFRRPSSRRIGEPLSAILTEFCEDTHGAITVGEIVDRFGSRAFGALAPAVCIGAFALALFQRDGVIALVGYLMASVSLGLLILSAGVVSLAITKMIGAFHG